MSKATALDNVTPSLRPWRSPEPGRLGEHVAKPEKMVKMANDTSTVILFWIIPAIRSLTVIGWYSNVTTYCRTLKI